MRARGPIAWLVTLLPWLVAVALLVVGLATQASAQSGEFSAAYFAAGDFVTAVFGAGQMVVAAFGTGIEDVPTVVELQAAHH